VVDAAGMGVWGAKASRRLFGLAAPKQRDDGYYPVRSLALWVFMYYDLTSSLFSFLFVDARNGDRIGK
jgi:hypothetical protein